MVEYEYESLFAENSIKREIVISFDGGKLGNTDLHNEEFSLKESLCSENELRFGCCEASELKFRITNSIGSLKKKKIDVSSILNGHTENPFRYGLYTVESDEKSGDRRYRDITAYDKMYDVINAESSAWYNSLTFPMTLRQFRNSFCSYMGVEQEEITLVNDAMTVEETIKPSELSGKTVLESICEINGCFGHFGRDGKLHYVHLKLMQEGLYPSTDFYPSKDTFPRSGTVKYKIPRNNYTSCQYEDYICQKIDKLQIRQKENDIGAIAGTGNNCYIIEDNFLVYGKSAEELQTIADNVLQVINGIWYRPAKIDAHANPCLEVGDGVRISTREDIVYTYILQRTLKGIQNIQDSYTSEGEEYRSEKVNGVQKSIIQLRGKTNSLIRTVEENRLEMLDIEKGLSNDIQITAGGLNAEIQRASDAENLLSNNINITADGLQAEINRASAQEGNLSTKIETAASGLDIEVKRAKEVEQDLFSQIKVQAGDIKLKVSKGNVSAQLSLESGQVSITGNRFVLDSTNFSISADGKVTAKSIDITGGTINLQSAAQNYSDIVLKYGSYTCGMDGAGIKAVYSTNNTILTASGINSTGSVSAKTGYFDMISPKTTSGGTIAFSSSVKISGDTEFAIGHTHKIYGTLLIDTTAFAVTSSGNVKLASSLGNVGFFGSNGAQKKSVSKVTTPSSATAYSVATVVNNLIDALKAYNLIG